MRKLREIWKQYMLRPVLYKCVTKCAVMLAAVLLWNRYLNAEGTRSALEDGGFIAAVILLAAAWFSYLQLDGLRFHYFLEERKKKPKQKQHWTKDMVDFADEHITSWSELTKDERAACGLLSSLISALVFLIPALVALLF